MMDRAGRNELHYAALDNKPDAVGVLIQAGMDPNEQDKQGFTPLHLAAQQGSIGAARKLIELGAQVDIRNKFGNTSLFVAVFHSGGKGELIELLRRAGADPRAKNNAGQSPAGLARLIGNVDVSSYFADVQE